MLQNLKYIENPVDIPNPDRGFYIAIENVVPVEGGVPADIPELSTTIKGTNVSVDSRIIYTSFDLKHFSSNAPLNRTPSGPWTTADDPPIEYGKTQPITPAALDFMQAFLQKIRDSKAVCMLKFGYDGQGHTYNNRGGYDDFLHDPEPGAPEGRAWFESGGKNGGTREESDLCGISGHEDKNWVQYHLWQLSSIFKEFEDVIMCVKGGFFGPWGEMHASSYARTASGYHWLLQALLTYVPPSRSILVHAGGVMAWYNTEYGTAHGFTNLPPTPKRGTPYSRFGMFNDSYSMGTHDFSDGASLAEGFRLLDGKYCRNGALTWMRNQNNFYGGETNTIREGFDPSGIYAVFPNVPVEATYAGTSHLNVDWAPYVHRTWEDFVYSEKSMTKPFTPPHDNVTRTAYFDPTYDGRNGLAYMRDRLGYRLVLRAAHMDEEVGVNGILKFNGKIQNAGFGNIINAKKVTLLLHSKNPGQGYEAGPRRVPPRLEMVLADIDPRDWIRADNNRPDNTDAWHDISFTVNMSELGEAPPDEYFVYLKINDPMETTKNKRCIQFANYDIWNEVLGANLIGSVRVV